MTEPITVCLDFDGVLANYTVWNGTIGELNPEGIRLARLLHNTGFKIIVQSCRTNPSFKDAEKNKQEMMAWLIKNKIPFDELCTEGKAVANIYVDDMCVHFPSNKGPAVFVFSVILKRLKEVNEEYERKT